jgi:prolyl-tRNA editing enzyme YbaK/EbsC (Cys-tRNA(Pro) deacylase)
LIVAFRTGQTGSAASDDQRAEAALTLGRGKEFGMDDALPASARKVQDALMAAGMVAAAGVRQLPVSARTAAEAAQALGCEVGAIANSLIFMADETPLLVMTSGAHRVAVDALTRRLGRTHIRRATPTEVRAATGQAIGGVAPVGHPSPIETIVDTDLEGYERIWAAAGTPHSVFPTTFKALLQLTGGAAMPVADDEGRGSDS